MRRYKVHDIFRSFQGEGGWVGTQMVFIRFSGCNLRCSFCDTIHESGEDLTGQEILNRVLTLVGKYEPLMPVCFTGGEPCLQLDTDLIRMFPGPLHLETNGTQKIPMPAAFRCVTVSPKTLLTDGCRERLHSVFAINSELKLVWDEMREEWSKALMEDWGRRLFARKFLQPITRPDGTTCVRRVLEVLKAHSDWGLSIQVQKILGIP